MDNSAGSYFDRLPEELRLRIAELTLANQTFHFPKPSREQGTAATADSHALGLALTCKKFHNLAIDIAYQTSDFYIDVYPKEDARTFAKSILEPLRAAGLEPRSIKMLFHADMWKPSRDLQSLIYTMEELYMDDNFRLSASFLFPTKIAKPVNHADDLDYIHDHTLCFDFDVANLSYGHEQAMDRMKWDGEYYGMIDGHWCMDNVDLLWPVLRRNLFLLSVRDNYQVTTGALNLPDSGYDMEAESDSDCDADGEEDEGAATSPSQKEDGKVDEEEEEEGGRIPRDQAEDAHGQESWSGDGKEGEDASSEDWYEEGGRAQGRLEWFTPQW